VALFAGIIILIFMAVIIVYGIFGALAAWQGRNFRYAAVNMLLHMQETRDQQATEARTESSTTEVQDETERPDMQTAGAEARPEHAPAEPADQEKVSPSAGGQADIEPSSTETSASTGKQAKPEPQPSTEEEAGKPADDDKQHTTNREAKD
jgi:type II secretory pathway pseudopilin PulG